MKIGFRTISKWLVIFSALTALTVFGNQDAQAEHFLSPQTGFIQMDCPMDISEIYSVTCGMVVVPENHLDPKSKDIQLAIAIFHSLSESPAPDPVLYIDGGPGSQTLTYLKESQSINWLNPMLAERDVIFFDQRGTGYSIPNLSCPETYAAATIEETFQPEPLAACWDRLVDSGIDFSAYNSFQNAADIAALREILGYDQWNLFGVSYGTRVALTVLRDHPEGIRSVVLDSVQPLEGNIALDDPDNLDSTITTILKICETDFLCRTAYPDLEEVYANLMDNLSANPVDLELHNAITNETRQIVLDAKLLNDYVIASLSMPFTSGLPGLIYEVQAGNYAPIIINLEAAWRDVSSGKNPPELRAALGLQLSAMCNEEYAFTTQEEMAQMLAKTPPNRNSLAALNQLIYDSCAIWEAGKSDPVENEPVYSDVPALILTGGYDLAPTPAIAQRTASALSQSTVVEFPGVGHVVTSAGACPQTIILQFLNDPNASLSTICLDEMPAPEFYLTLLSTRPTAHILAVITGLMGFSIFLTQTINLYKLQRQGLTAWKSAWGQIGWRAFAISFLLPIPLYMAMPWIDLTYFYEHSLIQAVLIVTPLTAAIQLAALISPTEEPSLEMLLTTPRKFQTLFIERIALVLGGHFLGASILTLIAVWGLGEIYPATAATGWLSSILFLSGLAVFAGVRSRKSTVGVLMALLAWLVLGISGSEILSILPAVPLDTWQFPWPRPLGFIQPFIWISHPFLSPNSLTAYDFALNRVIVGGIGLCLMWFSLTRLNDSEWLLLGKKK